MARESETRAFGELVNFVSEKSKAVDASLEAYVSTENMRPYFGGVVTATTLPENGSVTNFKFNDTLFSNIRTYFKKVWKAEFDGHCSNDILVFRSRDESVLCSEYIHNLCRWEKFTELSIRTSRGVKMPRGDKNALKQFRFQLPPIQTQHAVVRTIGALDEKIALNRRINQTLEAIAQALFKSWFVDFDGVAKKDMQESELGLIPKRWRVGSIYDIAEVRYGAPFASSKFNTLGNGSPLVRIRDLRNECPGVWTTEIHPKGYLIQPGDIIVGMDGEFRAYLWGGSPALMNQRVCAFHPKQLHCAAFVHNAIAPHLARVEATEVATTVIHLGKGDIDEFRVVIPPDEIAEKFSILCRPLYENIVTKKQQTATLANIRNALLPKLLSGELSTEALSTEATH